MPTQASNLRVVDDEPAIVGLGQRRPTVSRFEGYEGWFWIGASALLLTTGIVKGINLVIVLAYLLTGLWGINLMLSRRAVRGIAAKRARIGPVSAGVPHYWQLEVRDPGTSGGHWVLEERIGNTTAVWLIHRKRGASLARPKVRLTFKQRGVYPVAPLVARSGYPFGLANATNALLPADEVVVFPNPARIDGERLRGWLSHSVPTGAEERRQRRRVVEREAEIHGLRDYRTGDSPRRIHWKATARRNRLTVREYEDASPPRLLLIVDPWVPEIPTDDDRTQMERVLSLAAGICSEWLGQPGSRLALVVAGQKPARVESPAGVERFLTALAMAQGGESAADASGSVGLSRAAKASPTLVITSRANSPLIVEVQQALGRSPAVVDVSRPEAWYRLPTLYSGPGEVTVEPE